MFPLDHRLLFALITAGGAAFPPILGFFARQTGSIANGYIVPLLGYLAVGLYGLIVRRKTVDSVPVHD
jgi:FHS family L-fucose permease-like MFS transporter